MSNATQLLTKLKSLDLPLADFAIFGSGPMYPRGIKDLGNDLDIVVRGAAWQKAQEYGEAKLLWEGNDVMGIVLFDGEIEIAHGWGPGEWDLDTLIDEADIFDGIRYVNLPTLIKWKKLLGREKDLQHVQMIEEYLEKTL